jgi:hypothetical protein
MATVVLQIAGAAIGTMLGGPVGGMIGRAAGAIVGSFVDNALFGRTSRSQGPRLDSLRVMSSEEGAAIPRLHGRMRIAGQVIWATELEEVSTTQTQKASAKGGPKAKTTTYSYYGNFAVGLCAGEIARIGRVWADGSEIDLDRFTTRLYPGTEDQQPDSLISAKEGAENAPAYRGLAYIVFERLPLADFGNRLPQLSFEVIKPVVGGAAESVAGLVIIPGATEFGYDTTPVSRTLGPGQSASENAHLSAGRSDWSLSLDEAQATCPNLRHVSLTVAWFGDDLRCGHCRLKPGVDNAVKVTVPESWAVAGLTRSTAHLISTVAGAPAFGGTPADAAVIRAIQDARARGLKVMMNPFILMDIPAGNTLPDASGAMGQPPYPWRGRIGLALAPGLPGTSDKTAAAASEVAAFVGTASASHYSVNGTTVAYSGPAEWSYRRMVLHMAALARAAGGVDAFVIGSELRGLTTIRSAASTYPFVAALVALAAEVQQMLPDARLTYGADWSEYWGHQPGDGTGDRLFHLDPLWAAPEIAAVGIDNYFPLSDWRDGVSHLDREAGFRSPHDPAYLEQGITGGEGHDWYYASPADRAAQRRTPIRDAALGKDWVFRPKDLLGWWSNQHHDRPGGVEAAAPTAWVPQSKPIWFTEAGCPAIDKGANQPNQFFDAKSAESGLPWFSSGERDDLIQYRYAEVLNRFWARAGAHNPFSARYGGTMVDASRIYLWCWDARPYPAFPALADVWSDSANYARGHWLNGRLGAVDLGRLIAEVAADHGLPPVAVEGVHALIDGLVLDRPMSGREALEELLAGFAIDAVERGDSMAFRGRALATGPDLARADLVEEEGRELFTLNRTQETDLPLALRLAYAESGLDYRSAVVRAERQGVASAREVTLSMPCALRQGLAQARADVALAETWRQREEVSFALPPSWGALEPGDAVTLEGAHFRLTGVTDGGSLQMVARAHDDRVYAVSEAAARGGGMKPATVFGPPQVVVLDLPHWEGSTDGAPWFAVQATPWPGSLALSRQQGEASFLFDRTLDAQATMGRTTTALAAGVQHRFDWATALTVELDHGALHSASDAEVLNGANMAAVGDAASGFEVLQFGRAELIAPKTYRLSRLLRAQGGSEAEMPNARPAGAHFVLINAAVVQPAGTGAGAGVWRVGPVHYDVGHPAVTEVASDEAARAFRPLSPCRLRLSRTAAGIVARWIRRGRVAADAWEREEIPLGEEREAYRVEIWRAGAKLRSAEVTSPEWLYAAADETIDRGGTASPLSLRVAQLSATHGPGNFTEMTLDV